ncbi:MAG: hypothetical protein WA144_01610 [Candidatus Methanoperedens sp.]
MSKTTRTEKKNIEQYDHKGKERCNNPPVGLREAIEFCKASRLNNAEVYR